MLGQVGIYFRCNAQQVAIGKRRSHDAETDRSFNHSIEVVYEAINKKKAGLRQKKKIYFRSEA